MNTPRFIIQVLFMMFVSLVNNQAGLFADESNNLTFKVVSGVPKNGKVEEFLKQIYTEAFKRLGISIEYQYYPFNRSALMLDNDLVEADLARQYSFGNLHPQLIRVEEFGYIDSYAAFAVDSSILMDGWESLKSPNLRIDYLRGHSRIEEQIDRMGLENKLVSLAKDEQGLERLRYGLSDVYLSSELFVKILLATDEFKDSNIKMVGILETVKLYAYLSRNHQELARKLSDVLKEMKSEGLIDYYMSSAIEIEK